MPFIVDVGAGPLIPRRRLGATFRRIREARGETLQQAGRALLFSPSKLSRIENGQAGEPHPRDIRDLIAYFEIDINESIAIEELSTRSSPTRDRRAASASSRR